MNTGLAILLTIYVITIILDTVISRKQQDLIREILDFKLELVTERGKIVQIIIDSEINKENYFVTLSKIEKVLAEDYQSNN